VEGDNVKITNSIIWGFGKTSIYLNGPNISKFEIRNNDFFNGNLTIANGVNGIKSEMIIAENRFENSGIRLAGEINGIG
jgi:hypothetical protein